MRLLSIRAIPTSSSSLRSGTAGLGTRGETETCWGQSFPPLPHLIRPSLLPPVTQSCSVLVPQLGTTGVGSCGKPHGSHHCGEMLVLHAAF